MEQAQSGQEIYYNKSMWLLACWIRHSGTHRKVETDRKSSYKMSTGCTRCSTTYAGNTVELIQSHTYVTVDSGQNGFTSSATIYVQPLRVSSALAICALGYSSELRMARQLGILVVCISILAVPYLVTASDEDALQDFCVADVNSTVKVNGFPCKPNANPEDFKSAFLKNPGNTSNALGAVVTNANVARFPGLNTLGVSFARIDYAPGGINPPHVHPRAAELLYLVQGTLYVGFVSTTNNTLFATTLSPGELFVFPRGLIHFQLNIGNETAFGLAGFNGQNPGVTQVAKAVFASNPPINDDLIGKAFQIDAQLVQKLRDLITKT